MVKRQEGTEDFGALMSKNGGEGEEESVLLVGGLRKRENDGFFKVLGRYL